jgi:hypothetical protein
MQVFIAGKNRKVLRREDNTAYYIDKKSGNKIDVTHMFKKGAKLVLKKKYIVGGTRYKWYIPHIDMNAYSLKHDLRYLDNWFKTTESSAKFDKFLTKLILTSTRLANFGNQVFIGDLEGIFGSDPIRSPNNFVSFIQVLINIFTVETHFATVNERKGMFNLYSSIPVLKLEHRDDIYKVLIEEANLTHDEVRSASQQQQLWLESYGHDNFFNGVVYQAKEDLKMFYNALANLYETFTTAGFQPGQIIDPVKVTSMQTNLNNIIKYKETFKFVYNKYNMIFKNKHKKVVAVSRKAPKLKTTREKISTRSKTATMRATRSTTATMRATRAKTSKRSKR